MAASGQIPMYVKPKDSERITPTKRKEGLGIFALLDDDDLVELLEFLDVDELRTMSRVSRIFYMFTSCEELWKSLCISRNVDQKTKTGNFEFKGTWRQTTLCPRAHNCKKSTLSLLNWKLSVTGYFSPFLYVKWFRGNVPISAFAKCPSNIDKRSKLTLQQFIDEYESINKPVIITDALKNWKAMSIWTRENILSKYGKTLFKTNGTDSNGKTFKLTLEQYIKYAENNRDDKPVYLFDNKYFERAPDMLKEFDVPSYFKEDMFDYMTNEDRPDYRWILVGGPRSGSPLHQDPHRTSAWNALICGRKRWVLYPPDVIPPGVDEELIDSEYYAAPDVMKWYLNYYPILKEHQKPMEIIQEPGETIFVPSGWWHQVLNLETSVAVTQNFCSSRNFNYVWKDMLERSGKALRRDFLAVVSKRHPELFEKYQQFEAQQKQQHSKVSSSESDSDSSSSDMSEDDT